MDSITLENFRCFYKEQTVPLAPLTLLVGENSTGKTSFMAMIRILWDSLSGLEYPDFKEEPYDLGSFEDMAHNRGGGVGKTKYFQVGFTESKYKFQARFEKNGATPILASRYYQKGQISLEEIFSDQTYTAQIQTENGTWRLEEPSIENQFQGLIYSPLLFYFSLVATNYVAKKELSKFKSINKSPNISDKDVEKVIDLRSDIYQTSIFNTRPFAGAPVRSKPRRTYDPSRYKVESEGDTVPMYLASKFFENEEKWKKYKSYLETFGKHTGLFDEIDIKSLTRNKKGNESEPFQLQVRKYDGKYKGPWHNIIDVGYGVNQTLPLMTELLNERTSSISLLQQPAIHLHPSAQAALGSLLCQVASPEKQIIVETHSEYLLDRVRMEVRDGSLDSDQVSLLFFERQGLDVKIHPIRFDETGNVVGSPPSYGKFFMEEVDRSIGLNS